jgi:CRISPR system Cascade subunit CasE
MIYQRRIKMYLSKITLDPEAKPSDFLKSLGRGLYYYHQCVWEEFFKTNGGDRDFLYRLDFNNFRPEFLTISERLPKESPPLWRVETKSYSPIIRDGQKFIFSTRVNPTIRKPKIGKDGKEREVRHDVVMDMKWSLRNSGKEVPPYTEMIQVAGINWLGYQGKRYGFTFNEDDIRIENYTQHKTNKKGDKIKFSTLDFMGLLTITDAEKFKVAMFKGIGPEKGFGCGLLLLMRA